MDELPQQSRLLYWQKMTKQIELKFPLPKEPILEYCELETLEESDQVFKQFDPVLNQDWEDDWWTIYGSQEDGLSNGFCIAFWTDSE